MISWYRFTDRFGVLFVDQTLTAQGKSVEILTEVNGNGSWFGSTYAIFSLSNYALSGKSEKPLLVAAIAMIGCMFLHTMNTNWRFRARVCLVLHGDFNPDFNSKQSLPSWAWRLGFDDADIFDDGVYVGFVDKYGLASFGRMILLPMHAVGIRWYFVPIGIEFIMWANHVMGVPTLAQKLYLAQARARRRRGSRSSSQDRKNENFP